MKFACYIKIMAFCLVELLRDSARGVPDASVNDTPTEPDTLNRGRLGTRR